MSILIPSNFTGNEYAIPKDCFTSLQPYIDKYERYYLTRLLGAELYNLFIADLTALPSPQVPQDAIYLSLFNEFSIDDNECIYISEGMIEMLKQFVYFHFMRDMSNHKKIAGVYRTNIETGTNLGYNGYNLVESYNQGVTNYKNIQWFICENDGDYPTENIQHLDYTSGL